MKLTPFLFALMGFFSCSVKAQTPADKADIYHAVTKEYIDANIQIINETISRIYKYDIDGNYDKWFYQTRYQTEDDTSFLIGSAICVVPVQYSQAVTSCFGSKNISVDPVDLLRQVDDFVLDSVSKYVLTDKVISWKKAPLSHSLDKNLFKKAKAIGLSNILFDSKGRVAVVKIQEFARSKKWNKSTSKIILFEKKGDNWIVTDTLHVKVNTM